jgi:hypothetical protein
VGAVAVNVGGLPPRQARDDVIAAAIGAGVVTRHRGGGARRRHETGRGLQQPQDKDCRAPRECPASMSTSVARAAATDRRPALAAKAAAQPSIIDARGHENAAPREVDTVA